MKRLVLALAAFSFVFLATGCGQTGPLYIPGNPSRISHPPPPPEDAAEEGEESEESEESDPDKQ
jgi:predicted small lipoprotein YifL